MVITDNVIRTAAKEQLILSSYGNTAVQQGDFPKLLVPLRGGCRCIPYYTSLRSDPFPAEGYGDGFCDESL